MAKSIAPIHLIGQGNISCLLAAQCLHKNVSVKQYVRQVKPQMSVNYIGADPLSLPAASLLTNKLMLEGIVIVPLKAFDVMQALPLLKHIIAPQATLVLLHNGLGTADSALRLFAEQQIVLGATSMAAYTQQNSDQFTVVHAGFGKTYLGEIHPGSLSEKLRKSRLAQLQSVIDDVAILEDIQPALWTKLAVNSVINPLTAIHDCQNGTLAEPRFDPIIEEILHELMVVAKAKHINLEMHRIQNTVAAVILDTKDNYSSMHQDITYQRRTEIDFINGYIVTLAEQMGIQVPTNKKLWQQLHKLEGRL